MDKKTLYKRKKETVYHFEESEIRAAIRARVGNPEDAACTFKWCCDNEIVWKLEVVVEEEKQEIEEEGWMLLVCCDRNMNKISSFKTSKGLINVFECSQCGSIEVKKDE